MQAQSYYISKIKEDFSLKQRQNPLYSLRAYARDMGIHPTTLSLMLKGERELPSKISGDVATKLKLGPKERTLFMESLYGTKTRLDDIKVIGDDRFILDESHYKAIAEWEHYAVIALFDIADFEATVQEVATRLNISVNRADVVLNNLLTCGLLKAEATGKLVKAVPLLRTTEDIQSQALQKSHLETLEMGKTKLEEIAVEFRDFSSMTISMDMEKMPEAKTIIREFRQKMSALLRDGHKTDVCQLAIQFYPLTNSKRN